MYPEIYNPVRDLIDPERWRRRSSEEDVYLPAMQGTCLHSTHIFGCAKP